MRIQPLYFRFYCYSLLLIIFSLLLLNLPYFQQSVTPNKVSSEGFAVSADGTVTESKGNFHAVVYELNALPRTTYSIDIMPISIDSHVKLVADLYVAGFDLQEQEKTISISSNKYKPITIDLYSGDAPPINFLRFMYSNKLPTNFSFKIKKIYFRDKGIIFLRNTLKALFLIFAICGIGHLFKKPPIKSFFAACRHTIEQNVFCAVLIIYFAISFLRFVTISYMPFWSGDEFAYKTLANSYWVYNDFFRMHPTFNIPNLLYPYIISPAFHFGDSFYSWLRLINCLVFSLSIIPVYILANNYVDNFKSIITSTITILIPWGNLSAYAVTEVLYFPCFLFCVLFLYYAMKSLRMGYVATLSISCSLLVNARPTGYIITIASLILLLLYAIAFHKRKWGFVSRIFIVFSAVFILSSLLINVSLNDSFFPGFGVYKASVLGVNTSILNICLNDGPGVIRLVIGHMAIFGIIYVLSISSSFTRIANVIRNHKHAQTINDPLLIITWTIFIVTLLATFIFTIKVSEIDLGGLERWHGRYYFFILPLFFIEAVRAISEKTTEQFRMLLICVAVFILSINFYFYIHDNALQFRWFGSIIDNMDAQWYKHFPWLYPYLIAIIILSLFFLVRINTAFVAWVSGTVLLLGIANIGTFVEARIFSVDDLRCSKLIQGTLKPSDLSQTAIYAKDRGGIVNPLFWLTKDLALAVQTGQTSTISLSDIPKNIKFVVTHDPVSLGFPVNKSIRCGDCEVHFLY